jgi:hypothetical protein
MVIQSASAGRPRGSKTRFQGIVADARILEKSPAHLWRVLTGSRSSKSLSQKYKALKVRQRTAVVAGKSQKNGHTTHPAD